MIRKTLKECPECGSPNIFRDQEKGETICRACGLVIEDRMVDFSQEWREFDEHNNLIHSKNSNGFETWKEYNKKNKLKNELIHYPNGNWELNGIEMVVKNERNDS